jgi:hypothetical protein
MISFLPYGAWIGIEFGPLEKASKRAEWSGPPLYGDP